MLFLVWRAHDQEIENYHQLTKLKETNNSAPPNPFQPGWSCDYMWLLGTYKRPRPRVVFNPPKSFPQLQAEGLCSSSGPEKEKAERQFAQVGGFGTQWTHLILLQDEWTRIVEKEAIHIKIRCVWQRLKGAISKHLLAFDAIFGKIENIKSMRFSIVKWVFPKIMVPPNHQF